MSDRSIEDMDPLKAMEERLKDLREKLDHSRSKAHGEGSGAVFTGALAAGALMIDWTVCGGLGSIFALACGVDFLHHNKQARRLSREVKKLEEIVTQIQTARATDPQFQKQLAAKSKPAFDKASQKRIRELEAKLKELESKSNSYFSDTKVFRKDNDPKKGTDGNKPPQQ